LQDIRFSVERGFGNSGRAVFETFAAGSLARRRYMMPEQDAAANDAGLKRKGRAQRMSK
jgi:hypothetical protein